MTLTRPSALHIRKRLSHGTDGAITASSIPARAPRTETDAVLVRQRNLISRLRPKTRQKRMLIGVALLVGVLGNGVGASAQVRDTEVTGRVLDPDGGVVADVVVAIYAIDRPYSATARADAEGRYRLPHLAAGHYLVSAQAPGLTSQTSPLAVKDEQSASFDITLSIVAVAEHVVVTAVDGAQTLQTVGKTMSVVSGNDLDAREIFNVADALRAVPGLRIQQRGAFGAFTSVQVRGLRPQHTAVLVDGFRFRDASATQGDSAGFVQDLLITGIDRIEILRGSGSSLYGSNAMGGVIDVISASGGGTPSGSAQFELGSLGMTRGTATVGGGALSNRLLYSGGLNVADMSKGLDANGTAHNVAGRARAQFAITPTLSLTGQIFGGRSRADLNVSPFAAPGQPSTPPSIPAVPVSLDDQHRLEAGLPLLGSGATFVPDLNDPDSTRNAHFVISAATIAGIAKRVMFRGNFSSVDVKRTFSDGPLGPRSQPSSVTVTDSTGHTDTANVQASVHSTRQTVTLIYEYERERYDSNSHDVRTASGTNVVQESQAVALQDAIQLSTLEVSLSGRMQRFGVTTPHYVGLVQSAYDRVVLTNLPTAWTGDAAVAYALDTRTTLRAHVGNGYRSPSAFERFGSSFLNGTYTLFGDPRLGPDRSVSTDAGLSRLLFKERLALGATLFSTRLSQVIVFDSTGGIDPRADPFGRSSGYRNTGGSSARGVELTIAAHPWRSLDLTGGYAFTDATDTGVNATGSRRVFGVSKHLLTLAATERVGPVTLALSFLDYSDYAVSLSGRAFIFDGPRRADLVAHYLTPHLRGTRLDLYVRGDNLFDNQWFENGFRVPGRTANAGVTFRF
jgi:vitamin B12 transporter